MPRSRFGVLTVLGNHLSSVQAILAFQRWKGYPQFENDTGFGRIALLACTLAFLLGLHVMLCMQLFMIRLGLLSQDIIGRWPEEILQMAMQWTIYVIALCSFHLGEFFMTALYNPSGASADSFMVNHSKAYTAAALVSLTEFWTRIIFFPRFNSPQIFFTGIVFVTGGQLCRSMAMATCGESFNHYIQREKKENHVLVTNGIYSILRHPSYVGFYYWAIGTQLLLCNPISTILYGLAAWTFFRHRVAYEEKMLRRLFPDGAYESYAARTYIGIPFLRLALRFDQTEQ